MYLTRIQLDLRRPETMRALASPNRFHGAIESVAEGQGTRKLWRIDALRGNQYLLILSEKELHWGHVLDQFGIKGGQAETKSYDGLLDRIKDGTKWHFLLKANPTIAKKDKTNPMARGKVLAHTGKEYQMEWLVKKSQRNGFLLREDEFLVVESQWYHFYKGSEQNNHRVKLLAVTYEGVLTVQDKDLFRHALTCGIGREKAYGMGLLTVVS